jgi:steroid delta-isomerase-like uncharacterized protein
VSGVTIDVSRDLASGAFVGNGPSAPSRCSTASRPAGRVDEHDHGVWLCCILTSLLDLERCMTRQDHLAALDRMNERINRHDVDFADGVYAADIEWWYAGMPDPMHGLDALKERDRSVAAAFPDVEREVIQVVADDATVSVRWRLSATHEGEYAGLPATGNRVEFTGCSLFEFEDGLVIRLAVYMDVATLMRQVSTST